MAGLSNALALEEYFHAATTCAVCRAEWQLKLDLRSNFCSD